VLVALLPLAGVHAGQAREDTGAAWQPTGLGEGVLELFTPASGAFFARTRDALLRSDDGGATWAPVNLPPPPARRPERGVAVDPTDHRSIYAAGAEGLFKTGDDAVTWQLRLRPPEPSASIRAIAVSPADTRLVYVLFEFGNQQDLLLVSRDGGATWEEVSRTASAGGRGPCTFHVRLFQPHPTVANRLFAVYGCFAGRDVRSGYAVRQSTDFGATWSLWAPSRDTFPGPLVGGEGTNAARFYLAEGPACPGCPSRLLRSDDDGGGWTSVLEYTGPPGSQAIPAILSVAYAAPMPDRVYVGVSHNIGVRASVDGGTTWSELGLRDQGNINALALGIDGRNLYAATDHGLWRLPLQPEPRPSPVPSLAAARLLSRQRRSSPTKSRPRQPIRAGEVSGSARDRRPQVRRER